MVSRDPRSRGRRRHLADLQALDHLTIEIDDKRFGIGETRLPVWLFLANAACSVCVHALFPYHYGDMLTTVG